MVYIGIVEPTNRKANCHYCSKVLNGKLPKLQTNYYNGFGRCNAYLCIKCAKNVCSPYYRKELNRYKRRLYSKKYINILVADEI